MIVVFFQCYSDTLQNFVCGVYRSHLVGRSVCPSASLYHFLVGARSHQLLDQFWS